MSKVYFITGASRGIGFALTKALAEDSGNVVLAAVRDPKKATELNALAASKENVHVIALDVASQESIDQLDSQLQKYAPDGIDYLISNAAIAADNLVPSMEVPREEWFKVFTTNTVGPIMLTKAVYPYMLKKDTRVIYLVSSVLGAIGNFMPFPFSPYGLSKAALNYYAKTLSHELGGEGFITVAAHPGVVDTEGARASNEGADPAIIELFEQHSITANQSATQQLAVIAKLTKEDNGKFLSYTGEEIPW